MRIGALGLRLRASRWRRRLIASLLAPALLLVAFGPVSLARADDIRMPRQTPPAYTQECGSCHLAYPPGLLPGASWRGLMAQLGKHYGSDASMDVAATRELGEWLVANAGTYRRVAEEPAQHRITRSTWFERKHRRIDASVWRLSSVKTPANCAACHVGAAQGRFDDDDLRVPEGLDSRLRRAWHH